MIRVWECELLPRNWPQGRTSGSTLCRLIHFRPRRQVHQKPEFPGIAKVEDRVAVVRSYCPRFAIMGLAEANAFASGARSFKDQHARSFKIVASKSVHGSLDIAKIVNLGLGIFEMFL